MAFAPRARLVPAAIALHAGTVAGVDLWRIDLDAAGDEQAALSPQERDRAGRFALARDRRRFAAGRGALRVVLGAYRGEDPGALAFDHGPHGKPFVPGGPAYSFSRSGPVALLGVGERREVGVDLEELRTVPEADDLARLVLSEAERAAWIAAGSDPGPGFLRAWTLREAALKAVGLGLGGIAGESVDVDVYPLDLFAGFAAALALAGAGPAVPRPAAEAGA